MMGWAAYLFDPETPTNALRSLLFALEIFEYLLVAHLAKINHGFLARLAKPALLSGQHLVPIFVARIGNLNAKFWIHDPLIPLAIKR
jgi:hypothetical protein